MFSELGLWCGHDVVSPLSSEIKERPRASKCEWRVGGQKAPDYECGRKYEYSDHERVVGGEVSRR